jgi:Type IV secretion system pilin
MINTSNKTVNILMAIFVIVIFSIFSIQAIQASGASTIETGLDTTAGTAGFQTDETGYVKSPSEIAASIVKVMLGFVGTLFLILIIVSGFQWMMAGGNSEILTKARKRMINATIGLIIILGAYTLTTFVIMKLVNL